MKDKDLIGEEIKYTAPGYSETGIVAMIEKDIGITIVNKDDPEDHLLCSYGPFSIKGKKDPFYNKQSYYKAYDIIISMLKEGFYDGALYREKMGLPPAITSKPVASDCQFNH